MRQVNLHQERGDTIIEVIFAIAIFSFVAISSLSIMNKGIATGERALETDLVRQQINSQAEALRFLHEAKVAGPGTAYAKTWTSLVTKQPTTAVPKAYGQDAASEFGAEAGKCKVPNGDGTKPFVLNARKAEVWSGTPTLTAAANTPNFTAYPQVDYDDDTSTVNAAYGIWVESVPSELVYQRRFVDFHIRACWSAPGTSIPMTLGTIVRLYDPV